MGDMVSVTYVTIDFVFYGYMNYIGLDYNTDTDSYSQRRDTSSNYDLIERDKFY